MAVTTHFLWQSQADKPETNSVILNSKKGHVISIINIYNKPTLLIFNEEQKLQLVNPETFKVIKTIALKTEGQNNRQIVFN